MDDLRDDAFRRSLRDFERTPWPGPEEDPVRVGDSGAMRLRWSAPVCTEPSSDGVACGAPAKHSSRGWRCWYHWPDAAKAAA